jgi:hypothetical protein
MGGAHAPCGTGLVVYLFACPCIHAPNLHELSTCPSFQVRIYGNINFKEFVKLLSAFSSRASRETKLQYMFMVHDVDGDGEDQWYAWEAAWEAPPGYMGHTLTGEAVSSLTLSPCLCVHGRNEQASSPRRTCRSC